MSNLKRALQIRSNKNLSVTFSFLGTTNTIFWTSYGVLRNDPWVSTGIGGGGGGGEEGEVGRRRRWEEASNDLCALLPHIRP